MGIYWHDVVFYGFCLDMHFLLKGIDTRSMAANDIRKAVLEKLEELTKEDKEALMGNSVEVEVYYHHVRFSYGGTECIREVNGKRQAVRPNPSAQQRESAHVLLKHIAPSLRPRYTVGTWAMRVCTTTLMPDDLPGMEAMTRLGD
jgi:hypothetical protein